MESMQKVTLQCRETIAGTKPIIRTPELMVDLVHLPGDPENANRLQCRFKSIHLEILPSKGFSLAQAWFGEKKLFWDAPINLPDTDALDLWSDEVCINGKAMKGFTFLKTMLAGIEFYGLKNWGMPCIKDGSQELLHGETSNIPVDEVTIEHNATGCSLQATFVYRNFSDGLGKEWYKNGAALYRITRKLILGNEIDGIRLEDHIENITDTNQTPDWGYHITFRAEDGAKIIVPSSLAFPRGGGILPEDFHIWHKAKDPGTRLETGIIYKELRSDKGSRNTTTLIQYPGGDTIEIIVPQVPYFQTWLCRGGKGTKEFTYRDGESLLQENWDGMGIEIGSSALDHDGNTDESVDYRGELNPGEKKTIEIQIKIKE